MNRMHNHTPELGITALAQGKRWGQAIHGHQPQPRRLPLQAPEQESPGVGADHVAPRAGLDAAINHQKVSMKDAGGSHRIATSPHEEGAGRRRDQKIVQIDLALDVVVGRTGEAGGYRLRGQGQRPPGPMSAQGPGRLRNA